MRTEVALLGRMIFGIDKDRVVRAGGHAGFATNANRFIKINDAISPLEHRGRRAGSYTRGVGALVATRDLVRPSRLREAADVHMFDVRARNADRYDVFRLTRRRAGMATNAACLVDDLGPLDGVGFYVHVVFGEWDSELYHARESAVSSQQSRLMRAIRHR